MHFEGFNKRLDEWVTADRIDVKSLPPIVRFKPPNIDKKRKRDASDNQKDTKDKDASLNAVKDKGKETLPPTDTFSKEKEIEKLRTSGSMTQSAAEIGRLKNIDRIAIGDFEVDTWYFSPYPEPLCALPLLYICEFCLDAW